MELQKVGRDTVKMPRNTLDLIGIDFIKPIKYSSTIMYNLNTFNLEAVAINMN